MGKTAVVIPAYNAASHLAGVIEATALVVPKEQIIVVDDGSSDNTRDIATRAGVVVVAHDGNQGKGVALSTGIRKATELGKEFAITLDADAQHNPSEIPKFLECQRRTDADIIVGDRMSDTKNMPFMRVLANKVTSAVVSHKAGARIPDSQNGYRMIRTATFAKVTLETRRYDTESEILIKAGRIGAKIESVPVETIYGEEQSSVNALVDTYRFFRMVMKSFFW